MAIQQFGRQQQLRHLHLMFLGSKGSDVRKRIPEALQFRFKLRRCHFTNQFNAFLNLPVIRLEVEPDGWSDMSFNLCPVHTLLVLNSTSLVT
ncbi:hypothetical protein NPIL_370441 [Nephila pilipes]|uniref:Uncharacterized protein n=1 Tax=Nephila pilipes TaxID=299642 RepID=A0A8X6NLZ4_NEPPI|nr:hypothetical protein NPIL_370441 [Nephila pilipes]